MPASASCACRASPIPSFRPWPTPTSWPASSILRPATSARCRCGTSITCVSWTTAASSTACMRKLVLLLALLLAACGTAAPAPSSPAPVASKPAPQASGLTHIKIALTSKSTGGLYLYVGKNLGIYQKYGIDPEIVIGQSAALATGLV